MLASDPLMANIFGDHLCRPDTQAVRGLFPAGLGIPIERKSVGTSPPLSELLQLIATHQPDLLGLSLSIYFNLRKLIAALDAVTRRYPHLPIIVVVRRFVGERRRP